MMAVANACSEARTFARAQELLTLVGDQHELSLQNPDEFVLRGVPVALARPTPRWKPQEIDTELTQPGRLAEPPSLSIPARLIERRRIAAAFANGHFGDLDFRHTQPLGSLHLHCVGTRDASGLIPWI